MTQPSPAVKDPDERQRARTIAAVLLVIALLVLYPILLTIDMGRTVSPRMAILGVALVSYGLSRTRFFRIGGTISIVALWLLPLIATRLGINSSEIFVLGITRLTLLSIICTYVLFSLRASVTLTLAVTVSYLLFAPDAPPQATPLRIAGDFLTSAITLFIVFLVVSQFDEVMRKHTERALNVSEERYRTIVETQSEMICRWLPNGTFSFVNEAYCNYIGKTREQLLNSPVQAIIYPADIPHFNAMIAQMTRDNPTVTYEHRVEVDGQLHWHQWTDHAIFDDNGELIEYQSVGHDITALKRIEEAEREQRIFAEAMRKTAALISGTLQLDEVLDRILDQVMLVNPLYSAELMLIEDDHARIVRARGAYTHREFDMVMGLRFAISQTRNLRTMIETGKPLYIADVLNYADWAPVETSWIRAYAGVCIRIEDEPIGFLSITSDQPNKFTEQHITQLQAFADQAAIAIRNARLYDSINQHASELEALVKKRTIELELANQHLEVILDGTGEGIFYSVGSKILYANSALARLFGYKSSEIIGQSIAILFGDQPRDSVQAALDVIGDKVREFGVWRGEITLQRANGMNFEAGFTLSVLGSSNELPLRAVAVVRDISREKALQVQRSNLVAFASHELRTPITNLKTRLYLLRNRPENLEYHLEILDEVTERMQHLVENLLDISRLEHGLIRLKRSDLTLQVVTQTVLMLQQPEAERKRINLDWVFPENPVRISGDRERLIQVITNLVTNAINYTPEDGRIFVTISETETEATLQIKDTGIGINPDDLPHIFQPFYRVISTVEGTGLGLSIAKEIIEIHDGTIEVVSEPNAGSNFIIKLPIVRTMAIEET